MPGSGFVTSAPAANDQGEAQGVPERTTIQTAALATNPDPGSYAYREDARALARTLAERHGLDPAWAAAALAQARVNDSVTRLIMPAATPAAKNWGAYRARFVEPIRVRAGVAFWRTHEATLRRAEASYGVPMAIIAGIIGVETVYGRNTGNFRVLDALATLSLDFPKGRSDRSAYFQDELGQLLRLCADQGDDPTTVLGSYAGAIGLPQFMPGSIRRFGVDFDGDGRIDLRNNPVDAIGSVAHYLAQHGWQRGMPTHYAVAPPADAAMRERLLGPDIVPSFTAAELAQAGAELAPAGQGHAGLMALVLLYNGDAAPTYVAGTDNFYAITRYNQSSYYALAVADLGEAVARAVAAAPTK
ncbi:MAG: lytic murein transglycosylase B [Rubrivivax sp.]|nr:MAG: lytic murein transglycosylase B [Rubrivivax sp.]